MEFSDIIIVDIREEFELLEKQIQSNDSSIFVANIPMRTIFANADWINDLSQSHTIYLVCRSGVRAGKIKNKYFDKNKNVVVFDGGVNKLELADIFSGKIKIIYGKGGYGLQQYIQMMFAFILTVLLALLYFDVDKKYIMVLITLFVFFIIYQLLTNTCYLFKMLPLPKFQLK